MKGLLLPLVFLFSLGTAKAQLNIQHLSEEQYSVSGLPGLETGISGLTPLADRLGRPYLYVASNEEGLKIYETDPLLNLIHTFDTITLLDQVSTLEQRDTLLFAGIGSIFSDTLDTGAVFIINVVDPANPSIVGSWVNPNPTQGIASGVGVIRVQGDFCYVGSMAEGLIILDISNPSNPTFVSQLAPPIDFPHVNNTQPKVNARGMSLKDSLVYLCYDAGGVRVINCADPYNPVQIEEFANPVTFVPSNMPRAYNNIVVSDTLAYVAVDYCGLEVWNISDPTDVQLLTHWNPVNCPTGLWWQAPIHTNEIILQEDCKMLFISTGKSDMVVVDIADPLMPVAIDSFGTTLDTTGTWGVDVTNDRIYLTYTYVPTWIPPILVPFYSTWNGIKQLSYTKCNAGIKPEEISGLDVYPNPANDQLTLQWDRPFSYQIIDFLGRTIQSGQSNGNSKQLSVDEISPGMYQVLVSDGTFISTKKIWVNR